MPTVFTKIITGKLPGRFVWKDPDVVAFLTIRPIRPGHVLVVPRKEVDHWLDLEPALARALMDVSQTVGKAVHKTFRPEKVGMMIAGLEVPHVHIHLVPIKTLGDMDFANQDPNPRAEEMDAVAEKIRQALRELGATGVST